MDRLGTVLMSRENLLAGSIIVCFPGTLEPSLRSTSGAKWLQKAPEPLWLRGFAVHSDSRGGSQVWFLVSIPQ